MRAINRDDRQPLIQFEINHGLSILRQYKFEGRGERSTERDRTLWPPAAVLHNKAMAEPADPSPNRHCQVVLSATQWRTEMTDRFADWSQVTAPDAAA